MLLRYGRMLTVFGTLLKEIETAIHLIEILVLFQSLEFYNIVANNYGDYIWTLNFEIRFLYRAKAQIGKYFEYPG